MATKTRDERREERQRRREGKRKQQAALAGADAETRRQALFGNLLRLRRQRTGG